MACLEPAVSGLRGQAHPEQPLRALTRWVRILPLVNKATGKGVRELRQR